MQLTVATFDLEDGEPEDFDSEARSRLRDNLRRWYAKFSAVSNSYSWPAALDDVLDLVFEVFWAEVTFSADLLRVKYLDEAPWEDPFSRSADDLRQVETFLGLTDNAELTLHADAMEMGRSFFIANEEAPDEDMVTWVRHFATLPSPVASGLAHVLGALGNAPFNNDASPQLLHYVDNLGRQLSFERMCRISERLASCAFPAEVGELTARVFAAETSHLTLDLRFFDYPETLWTIIDALDGHVRDELSLGIAQHVVDAAQSVSDVLGAIDALRS